MFVHAHCMCKLQSYVQKLTTVYLGIDRPIQGRRFMHCKSINTNDTIFFIVNINSTLIGENLPCDLQHKIRVVYLGKYRVVTLFSNLFMISASDLGSTRWIGS